MGMRVLQYTEQKMKIAGLKLASRILLSPIVPNFLFLWPLGHWQPGVIMIRRLDILSWGQPRQRGQDTPANSIMLYELIAVVSSILAALYKLQTYNEIGPSGLNRRGQGVRFHPAFRTCDHNTRPHFTLY